MKIRFFLASLLIIGTLKGFSQKRESLGSAINTEFDETHPLISTDGNTLYFVRINHPSNNFGKDGSNDVWYSDFRKDGSWDISRRMPVSINKDQYNDIFSVTPDGNTALIRGVYIKGKIQDEVGISVCKRTKTGWSLPEKLEIPKLNSLCKGYFLTAYLSNNGKVLLLAFSNKKNSDKDDIFVSFADKKGVWSQPKNIGSDVNTDDVETTPFLSSDNTTLYFASDRKGGQGKKDIWVTKRLNRFWTKWSTPVNLGEKINTKEDDLFYSIAANGQYAYMATNENSVGKGDIVRFKLFEDAPSSEIASLPTEPVSDTKNQPELTTTNPTPVVMLSGKVIDEKTGKPVDAKIIYETLQDGEEAGIAYTDPRTGEYKIVLPYGSQYTIRAEAKDFIAVGKNIDLTTVGKYREITNEELKLVPIIVGSSVTLTNIFFEFGKATLRDESFSELNRMVDVMQGNPTLVVEIQGHTDNVGSDEANLKLSEERAEAVRSYFLTKKIDPIRVRSVGFGESRPIAGNETEEGKAKNRRVEFLIIKK